MKKRFTSIFAMVLAIVFLVSVPLTVSAATMMYCERDTGPNGGIHSGQMTPHTLRWFSFPNEAYTENCLTSGCRVTITPKRQVWQCDSCGYRHSYPEKRDIDQSHSLATCKFRL